MMMGMNMAGSSEIDRYAGKRVVGVWELICWAFQREKINLDFDEIARETGAATGVGMEYILMEQARLGCRVQGGGSSPRHHDADLVAATLAVLPEGCGGRRMACEIAELARSGMTPEYGRIPSVKPADIVENQHGWRAKTEDAAKLGPEGWPHQARRNRKGGIVYDAVKFCPVSIRPTVQEQGAMRRRYLLWWSALFEIRSAMQLAHLTSFVVTDAMPPRAPWREGA